MQTNELNLKKIRNESKVGLKEISQALGKSQSHLQRLEKNVMQFRLWEVEKYLGYLGYGVDFTEFIKECVNPRCTDVFTRGELEQAIQSACGELEQTIQAERKNTTFYQNENLQLTAKNEKLEKELEEYKQIILGIAAEKYTKKVN